MFNLRIILLVNFFMVIYFSTMEIEATKYFLREKEEISEQIAAQYFSRNLANTILPLVQMLDKYTMELSPPQSLSKVFVDNEFGQLIKGTQFTSKYNAIQTLFCPKQNSEENCLVDERFNELDALKCDKELKPVVRKTSEDFSCGADDIGKSHTMGYDICPRGPHVKDYQTKEVLIYGLCFDVNKRKTIFTSHMIGFPDLLDAFALRREHHLKYKFEMAAELIPSNIQELEAAQNRQDSKLSTTSRNKKQKTSEYKIQKLTPPEDLEFASSRKSTYQFFNTELQHRKLFPIWNEMNEKIRNHSKKMYSDGGIRFSINTGVFDLTSTPREDGQKSNVWVKLIFASLSINDPMYGMVILMNNFVDKIAKSSEPTEKSIFDYCKDDNCEDALKKKFEEIGGRVCCCSMNDNFRALFRWQEIATDSLKPNNTSVQLLRIPGINGLVEGESSKVDQ